MNFVQDAIILAIPCLVAFVLSVFAYPFYIRWLQSKQIGQFIREEGPQSHAVKAKTPTMGGLLFIAISSVVAISYLLVLRIARIWIFEPPPHPLRVAVIVIGIAALCGLVGFADDYGKVTSRSNRGLSAKLRLIVEYLFGCALAALLYWQHAIPRLEYVLPVYLGQLQPALNVLYLLFFAPFLIAATTNSVNVHDGMDGLSSGTSILVFLTLCVMLWLSGHYALALVSAAMIGALAGFLVYNRYPAKVFMGDTGSLYIGGLMAAIIFASGMALWFIPLSLIYIAETVSVILQVAYFKLTKEYAPDKPMSKLSLVWLKLTRRLPGEGKRLFRMAPLHHHFEAVGAEKGFAEWKVVACFWFVQLVLCVIGFAAFMHAS